MSTGICQKVANLDLRPTLSWNFNKSQINAKILSGIHHNSGV